MRMMWPAISFSTTGLVVSKLSPLNKSAHTSSKDSSQYLIKEPVYIISIVFSDFDAEACSAQPPSIQILSQCTDDSTSTHSGFWISSSDKPHAVVHAEDLDLLENVGNQGSAAAEHCCLH